MDNIINIVSDYFATIPTFDALIITLISCICVWLLNKVDKENESFIIALLKIIVTIVLILFATVWGNRLYMMIEADTVISVGEKILRIIGGLADVFGFTQFCSWVYDKFLHNNTQDDSSTEDESTDGDSSEDDLTEKHYKIMSSLSEEEQRIVKELYNSVSKQYPSNRVIETLRRKDVIKRINPLYGVPLTNNFRRDQIDVAYKYKLQSWVEDYIDKYMEPSENNC